MILVDDWSDRGRILRLDTPLPTGDVDDVRCREVPGQWVIASPTRPPNGAIQLAALGYDELHTGMSALRFLDVFPPGWCACTGTSGRAVRAGPDLE